MPIDLTSVWQSVNEGLLILLGGVALVIGGYTAYALHKYASFLTASQQQKLGDIINRGLQMAINFAMSKVDEAEKKVRPKTDSLVTKIAADYAVNHFGSTLARMGKTPSDVSEMILARLPSPPVIGDNTGAVVTVEKIEVTPLPPIP